MAQHDYVIANGTGAAVRSDINNGLAAIVSQNSGTSEPATMYAYQWWADTTTGLLKIRNAANNAWVTVGTLADANLGLLTSGSTIVAALGDASTPGITFTGDLNTGIFSPTADQLAISTSGTERVEFGTSEVVFNDGGANYDFRIEGDTNSSLFFVDASTDRVGIGTTSPGVALHVDGDIRCDGVYGETDTNTSIQFPGSDVITFNKGGSEAARIDSSGRLLIGTSTGFATSTVQIQGGPGGTTDAPQLALSRGLAPASISSGQFLASLDFTANNGGRFAAISAFADATPGNNDYPGTLTFSTTADGASSPTERIKILSTGEFFNYDVYSRTTASAANVFVQSDGSFKRSTSSGKYKTQVETLQDAYADQILNCRPVWYRSTCTSDDPEHGWWGFIAEEVAAIDPRLVHWKTVEVTYDENGSAVSAPCDPEPEGVAYDRFVPHLLNLIKRQGEAIAELQAEVAALKTS
jgi:hypothetical protein